ncbi:putative secreted protein [Alloactinosynnema sp. L-07]|uniref:hypothetical protein n=1 Tax=Alloactinosynnema sp. L-07 TaxID=1653480 RepID=UPI00065F096D|nr:hypothetical protein [Alloactinosynnema sp. L-07]CRK62082.1 putative secreted protein [Alloactinosynnema sp. L-07]
MSTGAIIAIVAAIIVIVAGLLFLANARRKRGHLRERFGPEYDRAVSEQPRREAERELGERERRVDGLDIHQLSPVSRERYAQQWILVQEHFVDRPGTAVEEADHLVNALMSERGYPTESFEQQAADLSVAHASTLEHYRAAHDIQTQNARTQVSTERLREAMIRYRALFDDLLGPGPQPSH